MMSVLIYQGFPFSRTTCSKFQLPSENVSGTWKCYMYNGLKVISFKTDHCQTV